MRPTDSAPLWAAIVLATTASCLRTPTDCAEYEAAVRRAGPPTPLASGVTSAARVGSDLMVVSRDGGGPTSFQVLGAAGSALSEPHSVNTFAIVFSSGEYGVVLDGHVPYAVRKDHSLANVFSSEQRTPYTGVAGSDNRFSFATSDFIAEFDPSTDTVTKLPLETGLDVVIARNAETTCALHTRQGDKTPSLACITPEHTTIEILSSEPAGTDGESPLALTAGDAFWKTGPGSGIQRAPLEAAAKSEPVQLDGKALSLRGTECGLFFSHLGQDGTSRVSFLGSTGMPFVLFEGAVAGLNIQDHEVLFIRDNSVFRLSF